MEEESFPSVEGGELPLPLKSFSWEAVDYREREGRAVCLEWRRGAVEIVLQRYFGVVFEERLKLNRTSALSGMKAKGSLLVFDSYCSSIVAVDILSVV